MVHFSVLVYFIEMQAPLSWNDSLDNILSRNHTTNCCDLECVAIAMNDIPDHILTRAIRYDSGMAGEGERQAVEGDGGAAPVAPARAHNGNVA